MANRQIQAYADMVNLQVAAEAFWGRLRDSSVTPRAILLIGNKNNSIEPAQVIDLFAPQDGTTPPRYKLIAHQDRSLNTTTIEQIGSTSALNKSGFSASIFLDTQTGQYTLSIRSTEFVTNINDPGDVRADSPEISLYGWAFAQINSLEAFWNSIKNGTIANGVNAATIPNGADLAGFVASLNSGGKVNVTGYSLGANIAEAFTELHRAEVNMAYFFNGAGTGKPISGQTFATVWSRYQAVFNDPSLFYSGGDLALTVGQIEARITYQANPNASYENLADNPRHILAIGAIRGLVSGAFAASTVLGSSLNAPRTADSQMVDLYAYHYGGSDVIDTFTARSGQRHGTIRPIWYEDQPASTWTSGQFSQWDFGQGHSIVLLQDSLNLMAAFEKLAPHVTEDRLAQLFGAASNVNFDSLERTLDALGRMLGFPNPVAAATADGQFAQIDLRNAFYARLKAVTDSEVYIGLQGMVTLLPASAAQLAVANTDFSAFLALQMLSPFVLITDSAGQALLKQANAELAQQWQADQSLSQSQKDAGQQTFTDNYYTDRALLLQTLVARNTQNLNAGQQVFHAGAPTDRATVFEFTDPSNPAAQAIFITQRQPGTGLPEQLIHFGGAGGDLIQGSDVNKLGDRLYGGGGNDSINGHVGDDYLEGNAGADSLSGGKGIDKLLGGAGDDSLIGGEQADLLLGGLGADTYILRAADGINTDTILDAGGQGSIKVFDASNSETVLGQDAITRIADGTSLWISQDKRFTYRTVLESDGSTTLTIGGAGVSAKVVNFSDGNLGINMPGLAPTKATRQTGGITVEGDRAPVAFDPVAAGVQSQVDEWGNLITDGASPDRKDTLYDSAGNDLIISYGGDDFVDAIRGGDDLVQSGAGTRFTIQATSPLKRRGT